MSFKLPKLPYDYDALEPHIDSRTMEIHHSKHHNGYTNNLNNAISGTDLEGKTIEEICSSPGLSGAVRNNGGGFYNHCLFWNIMSPNGGGKPSGKIEEAINNTYGSFENFKTEFSKAASTRFGSGWAWLSVVDGGKLEVSKTPNAENPWCHGSTPILTMDVWEHAYYLDVQNRRPDYIATFFELINWDKVAERYAAALA